MLITEKKCPNCGGKLKFDIKDKETKCTYCNSEFVIEDNNEDDNIDIEYIKLQEKQQNKMMAFTSFFIILICATIIIAFISMSRTFINFNNHSSSFFNTVSNNNKATTTNNNVVTKEISDKLFENSKEELKKWQSYLMNTTVEDNYQNIGFYYLNNDTSIKIIYIIKTTYKVSNDKKDVYTTFTYSGKDISSLDYNPIISLNRINLNSYDSILGYQSLETLFDKEVRKYKTYNYNISASSTKLYTD